MNFITLLSTLAGLIGQLKHLTRWQILELLGSVLAASAGTFQLKHQPQDAAVAGLAAAAIYLRALTQEAPSSVAERKAKEAAVAALRQAEIDARKDTQGWDPDRGA